MNYQNSKYNNHNNERRNHMNYQNSKSGNHYHDFKEEISMRKGMKKYVVMLLAVMMIIMNAAPAYAATSRYGEDKPLRTVSKGYYIESDNGAAHKHWYIDANNGVRYFLYDSCMKGMVGTTPTNHSSTVTIDGVKYSLCNYRRPDKTWTSYANVIRKTGGSSTPVPTSAAKKIALQKITLNKSSLNINVGSAARLSVSYTPYDTTDSRSVTWSSSNTSVATVSRGEVIARKPGTATITAKVGSKTSTCKVTVKAPLKSISLNKTNATMTAGKSMTISVTYNPGNTTDSKAVTWSSSNTSVATVSGGKVTAKKAGTARITAKVGSKTATCKITVNASSSGGSGTTTGGRTDAGSYKSVSDAYIILNQFRTTKSNQWYWNADNTAKVTVYGLSPLSRDANLENVAKIRAQEAWTMYYEKGRATHTRPNGKDCFTAYPATCKYRGENLAWGHTSSSSVILDPDWGWAETNKKYSAQGHRRCMLDRHFTKVGIACYTKNGKTCWAMCLAS